MSELLDQKVHEYQLILERKDELADLTKENNAAKEALEQEICQMMVDEEKPDTTVDGYKFSLQEKTIYSKLSDEKLLEKDLNFLDVLREQGLGNIIKEVVDPRTLSSTCKNIAEENDGEIPEELAEVLSVYSKMTLGRRKANTKALDRAKASKEG